MGSSAAGVTNTQEILSSPKRAMNKGSLQANAQLVRLGEREKKTHRESSSSSNEHPILLFHPETSRSRRPPEVPSALGTFRTAGDVETACCKRSPGSQREAWSPLPWGLRCPAVGGCLHKRGLSPSCVHRWTDTWTHTASLAPPPLCGDENPTQAAEPVGTSARSGGQCLIYTSFRRHKAATRAAPEEF